MGLKNNDVKCVDCGTTQEVIKQVYRETIDGKRISIKNVPMLFCNKCGEMYFTVDTIDRIDELTDNLVDGKLVYDFLIK